jgi:hypothetical protein
MNITIRVAIALFCIAFMQCHSLNEVFKDIVNTTEEQRKDTPSSSSYLSYMSSSSKTDTKIERQRKSVD